MGPRKASVFSPYVKARGNFSLNGNGTVREEQAPPLRRDGKGKKGFPPWGKLPPAEGDVGAADRGRGGKLSAKQTDKG